MEVHFTWKSNHPIYNLFETALGYASFASGICFGKRATKVKFYLFILSLTFKCAKLTIQMANHLIFSCKAISQHEL